MTYHKVSSTKKSRKKPPQSTHTTKKISISKIIKLLKDGHLLIMSVEYRKPNRYFISGEELPESSYYKIIENYPLIKESFETIIEDGKYYKTEHRFTLTSSPIEYINRWESVSTKDLMHLFNFKSFEEVKDFVDDSGFHFDFGVGTDKISGTHAMISR